MRGRKPKPAHLHLVTGTATRAGTSDTTIAPAVERPPTCPAHLSASAKAEWKRLVRILFEHGILGQMDRAALAVYCQAYGRWVEAERKLATTPVLLKLPSGYIQQSPWLSIANKAQDTMLRFASELGLSPVSRGRVAPRPVTPTPWEFD